MTSKTPLLVICLLLVSFGLFAQKSLVNGLLINENNEPIPFASVALFSLPDSAYVSGAASGVEGDFVLPAKPGNYFVKVSYVSYKPFIKSVKIESNKATTLGKISLIPTTTSLNEVTVEAERSQMELKLDKRVFNVGKDLSNTGGNAQTVLQNIPSVTIDVDGNVELRGSQNVTILINGRPSGLVGIDPAAAMEQIPANLIERVEVITNPSARYDAEGEVGIINIILKKEERKGLNGSFEIKGGLPKAYGFNTSLNYRSKNVNYFGSYGYNYRENPGQGSSFQEFFQSDSLTAYERTRNHVRGGFGHTLRAGADISLNKFNTLSVSGMYQDKDGLNTANLVYRDLGVNNEILLETYRNEIEQEPETNYEVSLVHIKKFEQKGREWVTELKHIENDETELSSIEETYNKLFTPLYQRSSNTEDESNWLFQTDYVHPIGNGKFEAGLKSTNRVIENDFLVEQHAGDQNWSTVGAFDSYFRYTEKIHAAYAMYSGNWGLNWKYQAGLRGEYSDILTEQIGTDVSNPRNYLNFFPSVHLTKNLADGASVQLSYSRRLSRPRFRHLLPYWGFSDNRNFMFGNPNLNPEYTNSFELGYVKYFDKGSFLGSVYYRLRNGVIQRISTADNNGIMIRRPVNLSTENAYGLELSGNYDPVKWLRFNGSLNAYRSIIDGEYEGTRLYAEAFTLNGRFSANIKIKKLNIQTSINYDAPRRNTQGIVLARYAWDMGLSYSVLNDKGNISLSGRDMLNTRIYQWETETPQFYSNNSFQWRTRVFMLTFSYKLNNYQEQKRKTRRGMDVNDNINAE
ncbi:MAG: TonB-dependent receptor [Bacteroidia bacterium]